MSQASTVRHWRISTRLQLGFAALAMLALCITAWAWLSLSRADARLAELVHGVAMRERLASDVQAAAQRRAIAARNLALDARGLQHGREQAAVAASQQAVQAGVAALQAAAQDGSANLGDLPALVDRVAQIEARYAPVAAAIVALALAGRNDEATQRLNSDCRPLLVELQQATDLLVRHQRQAQRDMADQSQAANARDLQLLTVAATVAALAASLLAVLLTRAVTRPLARAVDVAQAVAAGDLGTSITIGRHDEAGQLLSSLRTMNHCLVRTVTRVRHTAASVATTSAEIAAGNLALSTRADQQAAALQETAALMQAMTDAVAHNARTAGRARQLASATTAAAEDGGALMQRVVTTMDDIALASTRIADITGVIDGIAFQTNILALNAAVEAARAGGQGRGFAVVAGEVRALAQRAATAAREIRQLIGDSVKRVHSGQLLVTEAGSTMAGIVGQVRQVTLLMTEIDSTTQTQAGGIAQVNEAVSSIDQTLQQNAAMVEESAATAASLRQQADELRAVIAVFRNLPQQAALVA